MTQKPNIVLINADKTIFGKFKEAVRERYGSPYGFLTYETTEALRKRTEELREENAAREDEE